MFHTEVELIIVNAQPVGFDYPLMDGDQVAVYPVFAKLDNSPLLALLQKPPRAPRFILVVNLGKLARRLRLLAFDSLYRNDCRDAVIAELAAQEHRIVLARDRSLVHGKKSSMDIGSGRSQSSNK